MLKELLDSSCVLLRLRMKLSGISACIWAWTLLSSVCSAISNENLLKDARKSSNNVINLPGDSFKRVLDSPRESYILVHLTSTAPQIGCAVCVEANEEYEMIVASWFRDHPDGISRQKGKDEIGLFFAKADLKDPKNIPEIFSFYGLQHVPRYFLFAPGGDVKSYQVIELSGTAGMERAGEMVNSIRSLTDINDFKLYQPTDWSLAIVSGIVTFIVIYLLKRHLSLVVTVLSYKPLWAIVWTSFIILMLAGHMYNSIRNAQLAGVGSDGQIMYFLPNQTQNQFKIETQIVCVIYGGLVISLVSLILVVPKLKNYFKDMKRLPIFEASVSIFLAFLLYVFFAGYTAIFVIKQPGYPFSLMKLSSIFK